MVIDIDVTFIVFMALIYQQKHPIFYSLKIRQKKQIKLTYTSWGAFQIVATISVGGDTDRGRAVCPHKPPAAT